jgi:hypothetical protein
MKSPFKLSVINDEVSQDFERACEVISQEFGLSYIELRGMWGKNILKLDANETAEAQRILKKYELKVTDIASPLFKVDFPGSPGLEEVCMRGAISLWPTSPTSSRMTCSPCAYR